MSKPKPEPELEFPSQPFPASMQGHALQDTAHTMTMGISLYCFKPEAKAFPSIPLVEMDGVEIRAASNGRFIYFWAKNRLAAVSLEEIIKGARFHLTGKTEKKTAPEAPKEPAPARAAAVSVKRRVVCSVCKEMDIDLFDGTELDAISKNGWVITAGVATCPQCMAEPE